MKICTKCKVEKDESEFSKTISHGKRCLRTYCKECGNAVTRAYKKRIGYNSSIKNKETKKKCYIKNKDHYKTKSKNYYYNNTTKVKKRLKKYRDQNKDFIYAIQRKRTEQLTDGYVIANLGYQGFTKEYLIEHPEIIEAKKLIIKINRHVKEKANY